jgi:hypothetical protein
MGGSEVATPVIGMVQGQTLLLLVNGRQIAVPCGSMMYAAELAEAINNFTSEVLAESSPSSPEGGR